MLHVPAGCTPLKGMHMYHARTSHIIPILIGHLPLPLYFLRMPLFPVVLFAHILAVFFVGFIKVIRFE